jgi:hypothetical protein
LLRCADDPPNDPKLVLVFLDKIWKWSVASFYEGKWSVWEYGEKHPVLWWANLPRVGVSGVPGTPEEFERLRALIESGLNHALTRRSKLWRVGQFRPGHHSHRGWKRLGGGRKGDLRLCFGPTSSCGRVFVDA